MDTKANGHNLRVCGQEKGVRPELVERVRLMIEAVFKPVAKKGSLWVYIMTGPSEVLKHTSQYHLEIEPGSELSPRMVHVTMRASLLPDGSMHGMLQLPEDLQRDKFIKVIAPIIAALNQSGWSGVLLHEAREQAFDVGRPAVVTPLEQAKRTAQGLQDDDLLPPPRVKETVDGKTLIQRLRDDALARGQLDLPVRPASRPKSSSEVASTQPLCEVSSPQTKVITSEVIAPRGFPATRSGPTSAPIRKEAQMPNEVSYSASLNGLKSNVRVHEPESVQSLCSKRIALDQMIRDEVLKENQRLKEAIDVAQATLSVAKAEWANFRKQHASLLAVAIRK